MHGYTFRRQLSLLLTVIILCMQFPLTAMAALPDPSVELGYTCDTAVPGINSKMTFTIRGTNTAAVCLMIVDPFSRQDFQYAEQVEVVLQHPGVYTFIAYGTNTTDSSHPDFKRCYSVPVQIVLEGPQMQPGNVELMAWAGQDWQTLAGQEMTNKNVKLCIIGNAVPQEAELTVTVNGAGASCTLYDGPASAVLASDSASLEQKIACALSARSALDKMITNEYYNQTVSVEACFTLPDGQQTKGSGTLKLCNYTNAMRYMEQFIGEDRSLFSGEKGKALKKWLDMSPRPETQRNNSGYLLLEQQYLDLDENEWAYYIGTGGLKVLESIGTVGVNLIMDGINEAEMKELFPKSGNKGYVYYTQLSNLYMDYVSTLYQRMNETDEALQIATDMIGNTVEMLTAVDEAAQAREVMVAMNESHDLLFISNMWNTGSDAKIYNVLLSHNNDMIFTSSASLEQQAGKLQDILAQSLDNSHIIFNFDNHQYGQSAEESVMLFYKNLQFNHSRKLNFREMKIEAMNSSLEAMENTTAYQRLMPSEQQLMQKLKKETGKAAAERSRMLSEKAGKVLDVVDTAASVVDMTVSWVQYANQVDQVNGYYDMYFSILEDVSDDYIAMLDGWIDMLSKPHSQTEAINALISYAPQTDWELDWETTALMEALQLMKKDIRSTQQETSDYVAERIQQNTSVFTSKSLVSSIHSTLQVVTKIPFLKNSISKLGSTIINKIATATGKSTSALTAAIKNFNIATLIAQVAHLILSNTAGKVFSHYDALKQMTTSQYTLTAAFYELFQRYAYSQSDSAALACIAALNMIRTTKLQGEKLVEMYYLKDFYKDLGIENDEELQAILLNEYSASSQHLDVDDHVQKLYVIHTIKEDIAHSEQYYLPKGSKADFYLKGEKLSPLPANLQNMPDYNDRYMVEKSLEELRERRSGQPAGIPYGRYAVMPDFRSGVVLGSERPDFRSVVVLDSESAEKLKAYKERNQTPDGSKLYEEIVYYYQRDPLESEMSENEYEDYKWAEAQINAALAIDENELHWYNFSEKKDLKQLNKLAWIRITRKYIESLEMYDASKTY